MYKWVRLVVKQQSMCIFNKEEHKLAPKSVKWGEIGSQTAANGTDEIEKEEAIRDCRVGNLASKELLIYAAGATGAADEVVV